MLLVPCRYSLPWYRNPDTDFQDWIYFGLYWCNRPWFWLPSENRISAKQSWCCNLGRWWHLWLSSELSQRSACISGFEHDYFNFDKITGCVEGEYGYSWGRFRSFPAIRFFYFLHRVLLFKNFQSQWSRRSDCFSEWCRKSTVQLFISFFTVFLGKEAKVDF